MSGPSEERTETYRPTAGRVHSVRHEDYRYGDVALIVIVESVLRKVDFEGEPWWEVTVRWKEAQRYATDPWQRQRAIYIRADLFGLDGLQTQ